jgi:uncharacterized protein (TIGR02594 family)
MTDPRNKVGPYWLDEARKYIGVEEIKGPHHNENIIRWWKKIGSHFRDDETPWCAAFVGGVLEECSLKSTRSPAARSYLKLGAHLHRSALGCIVIFWRGKPDGWSGHVGFVVGEDEHGNLMVLGGNQGDAVSIRPFARARVLGYRWPGIWPYPWRYDLPLITGGGKLSTNES